MANSKAARAAENWVREFGLKTLFPGKSFSKKEIQLTTGGVFEFDCVAADESIFAHVSTSKGVTASGNVSTGPIHKVRGESLWFHLLDKPKARKVFIFTEQSLKKVFEDEAQRGRWPKEFEMFHLELPPDFQKEIEKLRDQSRDELKATSPELDEIVDSLGEEIIEEIKKRSK